VYRRYPVMVTVNGPDHIAAGTLKMSQIEDEMRLWTGVHEGVKFFLILNSGPQVIMQGPR
jgi:hypothetical protein